MRIASPFFCLKLKKILKFKDGLSSTVSHDKLDKKSITLRKKPADHVQRQFHRRSPLHMQIRAER